MAVFYRKSENLATQKANKSMFMIGESMGKVNGVGL